MEELIYKNPAGITEVYEIKPGSYVKKNHEKGVEQLQGYVNGLNNVEHIPATTGKSLNNYFNDIIIDSVINDDEEIVYKIYDNSGLIYYYPRKKQKKKNPVPNPAYSIETEKKRVDEIVQTTEMLVLLGIGLGMLADDFTGVGVADDPAAIAAILEALHKLVDLMSSCIS